MPTRETKPEDGKETTSSEPELFVQGGFGSNGELVPKAELKNQLDGDKS
jgi:hypothetical protein